MAETEDDNKSTLFCSFCGKSQHEVKSSSPDRLFLYVMNVLNYAWTLFVKSIKGP